MYAFLVYNRQSRSAGVAERWYMQAEPGVIKDTGEKK